MKRERMTFALCSAAVVMASVISFASVMCLVEAFTLSCDPVFLMVTCCLASGLAVMTMALKHSRIVGLCAFGVYFLILLWQRAALLNDVRTFLYHVTSEYALCFQVPVLGEPGGSVQWLLSAIAVPLAWLSVWTICREGYAAFVIMACAPIFVLCLLVVDLAPEFWLVLLTGALLLLVVSGGVRSHSANEGGRLIWCLALPVVIVFCGLMTLSPIKAYTRSDWSQNLQSVAEGTFDLEFWEKQVTSVISSGWNGSLKKVDLSDVGPQKRTGAYALEYRANFDISYLRGVSYGVYEDNAWHNIEEYDDWPMEEQPLISAPDSGSGVLQVHTPISEPLMYTTYYLSQMPEGGVGIDDAYIKNQEQMADYQVQFEPAFPVPAAQSAVYDSFVAQYYLQLPENLRQPLTDILFQADLMGASAEVIAAYVQQGGTYDLNTPSVPEGEDFALYFLQQSHQGYCVHFATSAALLLRAAGIPARYVTGYSVFGAAQQWNTVTQDEAHAWVEYYAQGIGWLPLDPTPASWRDDELLPETDPEQTLPQEPGMTEPEDTHEQGSLREPDRQKTPETKQSPWQWLLVLPCLVVLLILRRLAVLYCRRVRLTKGTPNRQALDLWNWLVRLYRTQGREVPEEWICLAEKAKFSQHVISDDERNAIRFAVDGRIQELKRASALHRLWHQYGLVLY